jgi:dephospho-CoA kinase
MINVGLTGGIACGKSTVAQMLVRHGAYLIDLDRIAHEIEEPEKPAWKKIIEVFGFEIIKESKEIDRGKLAKIVFTDNKKLKALNDIVHPYVLEEWQKRLKDIRNKDEHAIVLSDIPLLFEEKMEDLFDLTLLVLISPEEQINRLMARDCLSHDDAQLRLASQMPINEKIKLADIIIDNKGVVKETEKKVEEVWQKLRKIEKK